VIIFTRQQIDIVATYTACPENNASTAGLGDCAAVTNATTFTDDVKTLDVRYVLPADFSPVPPPAAFLPSASVAGVGLPGEVKFTLHGQSAAVPLESVKVQVFDAQGRLLHDSGFVQATTLSWKPLLNGRPLANGVYLYVTTTRDVLGNLKRTVNKFVYLR